MQAPTGSFWIKTTMWGSALASATLEGHTEVGRILLEHGADVDIRGGLFHTPLQAACVKERPNVFTDHGA